MKRREFLRILGLGAAAAVVAQLPGPLSTGAVASDRLKVGDVFTIAERAKDPATGISIRLVREFKVTGEVTRFDILYGYASPSLACRIASA